MLRTAVVIVAGGSGNRFESDLPKQYSLLHDKPILQWTVERFLAHPQITDVIVVTEFKNGVVCNSEALIIILKNGGMSRFAIMELTTQASRQESRMRTSWVALAGAPAFSI